MNDAPQICSDCLNNTVWPKYSRCATCQQLFLLAEIITALLEIRNQRPGGRP